MLDVIGIADYVLAKGDSEINHNRAVLNLLEVAQSNNLKFNPDKIQFSTRECKLFGHLLTWHGMSAGPKKVYAIMQMDVPWCKREFQNFWGMVNYLKHYFSQLTQLAEQLKELLRNETVWYWETKYQKAFEAIKDELTQNPYISILWPKGRSHHTSRWVKEGPRCSATQKGRPVMYASRMLTPTDRILKHWEGAPGYSIWLGKTTSLCVWQQDQVTDWPQDTNTHMEEVNYSS